jgi:hypothetical protein
MPRMRMYEALIFTALTPLCVFIVKVKVKFTLLTGHEGPEVE